METIDLKELSLYVSRMGGIEAVVEHITCQSNSWYGYWKGVSVTLYQGEFSVSVVVRYDEKGWVNGYGEVPNPTACAGNTARKVVSILEGLGYYVVAGPNC